jgi:hypothetical protein
MFFDYKLRNMTVTGGKRTRNRRSAGALEPRSGHENSIAGESRASEYIRQLARMQARRRASRAK